MRLRRLMVGLALAGASVLGAQRVLCRMAGGLPPAIAGGPRTIRANGLDVAIVERGDPTDPTVLFVHDLYPGASAREHAGLAMELAAQHHVVVMDLPGFGRSDRPPITYTSSVLADAIAAVATDLGDDVTVVASGLAVPPSVSAAEGAPIERVVAIAPRERYRPARPLVAASLRWPLVGTAAHLALTAKGPLRSQLGRHLESGVSDAELDIAWQSAHQPGARHGLAAVLAGDLDAFVPLEEASDRPSMAVVVGGDGRHPDVDTVRDLAEVTDAPLLVMDDAGAMAHRAHPAALATALVEHDLLGGGAAE